MLRYKTTHSPHRSSQQVVQHFQAWDLFEQRHSDIPPSSQPLASTNSPQQGWLKIRSAILQVSHCTLLQTYHLSVFKKTNERRSNRTRPNARTRKQRTEDRCHGWSPSSVPVRHSIFVSRSLTTLTWETVTTRLQWSANSLHTLAQRRERTARSSMRSPHNLKIGWTKLRSKSRGQALATMQEVCRRGASSLCTQSIYSHCGGCWNTIPLNNKKLAKDKASSTMAPVSPSSMVCYG